MSKYQAPVGVSNRHLHIDQQSLETLFGEGYVLTKMKDLSQPGQYACDEKVEVIGPKGSLLVRILGPVRSSTQVEISISDSFALGVPAVVRNSGDIEGSPGAVLKGPKGEVEISQGVIVAARHMHLHTSDAQKMGIADKDFVKVRSGGVRPVVFEDVLCRVHDDFALDIHLDMDEANAAAIKNGQLLEIIK
ncbi:MAG: phosphate propanoyltransferase [Tissierellia bacterium]|nr:phosphate propanoyltransferase [Bacillota bacterium]NLL23749.1 phosphate propanoyltransferase [Tissierellia bacterium]